MIIMAIRKAHFSILLMTLLISPMASSSNIADEYKARGKYLVIPLVMHRVVEQYLSPNGCWVNNSVLEGHGGPLTLSTYVNTLAI